MNLTRLVLGALAVMFFLFSSTSTFAQVTSFVPESQAVTILNNAKANAEVELSNLVVPVQSNQSSQDYATELAEHTITTNNLEFVIGVSEKMLTQISASTSTEAVKIALVSLLSAFENTSIDVASYAFADQSLSQDAAQINNYVLELLGE